MDRSQPRVLIAGLPPLMRDVRESLAADFAIISARDLPEAERRLKEDHPDCVVVAYHFDQMQAIRLIRFIRGEPDLARLPIVLVCVLNYHLGAKEDELSRAYGDAGVNAFFNLYDEVRKHGYEAALARFRASVLDAARLSRPAP
jgi:CheY-like chemotaxis protein